MNLQKDIIDILLRLDMLSQWNDKDLEPEANLILDLFAKEMKDLEMEYRKRRMHELDQKVIFEDISDILEGKTYSEIFYDNEKKI